MTCNVELAHLFRAWNPRKPLDRENPQDRKYYIDFSVVRGGNLIKQLERTIVNTPEPTCQLFTGHVGCGKTTELLSLKTALQNRGYEVIYFGANPELEVGDLDVSSILMVIAQQIIRKLENIQISIKPDRFKILLEQASNIVQGLDLKGELSVPLLKITAQAKSSSDVRQRLRQLWEPQADSLLAVINEELIQPLEQQIKTTGQTGLVVIADGLDRLVGIDRGTGRFTQAEFLFIERSDQLNRLGCDVVYTVPLSLAFSGDYGRMADHYGVQLKTLPMVPVQSRDGTRHERGMDLLRQMVLARAFPDLSVAQRLGCVSAIVDQDVTLDRLCQVSGGHVRFLLRLLYSCLQQLDELPITASVLERAIGSDRRLVVNGVALEEWDYLRQVEAGDLAPSEAIFQELLRKQLIYEYQEDNEAWFRINPILAEAKEMQR